MKYEIKISKSISYDCAKAINIIVAGSRGSGKTWLVFAMLLQLFQLDTPTQIFVVDFKQSDFSRFKNGVLHFGNVASTKEEIFALLEKFVDFMYSRIECMKSAKFGETALSLSLPLYILIYDEFGAFVPTLDSKERKKHDELISKIVLLGRQYNFGLWAILQQASVGNSGLPSNVKEQAGMIAHMGEATEESYRQTFGISINHPKIRLNSGEGLVWIQGLTMVGNVLPFCAPDLSEIDIWDNLKSNVPDQNDLYYIFHSK